MPVFVQIALGSLILVFCTLQHTWFLAALSRRLRANDKSVAQRPFVRLSMVVLSVLATHTVHVYFWAICILVSGALADYETAIYFSLVTYATLGYGDVTLSEDFRIFGTMAAVTGTVAFGLSTAFLVGYFARTSLTQDDDH